MNYFDAAHDGKQDTPKQSLIAAHHLQVPRAISSRAVAQREILCACEEHLGATVIALLPIAFA